MPDLWLETDRYLGADPDIYLCSNANGAREILIRLSTATACRLHIALEELLSKCTSPDEDYVPDEAE